MLHLNFIISNIGLKNKFKKIHLNQSTSVSKGVQRERVHPVSEAKTVKSACFLADFYLISSFSTP